MWKIDKANVIGLIVLVVAVFAVAFFAANPQESVEEVQGPIVTPAPPRDDDPEPIAREYSLTPKTAGRTETNDYSASFCGYSFEDETHEQPKIELVGRYYITGYDICLECCGTTAGITASGAVAEVGRTAAVGQGTYEYGTKLWMPGIGERVVEDRGGLGPMCIDILCEDHEKCREITGWYDVYRVIDNA